ncbi:MAG: hypothetical protein WDN25_00785 [Acetobacteraceae bacterium]
MLDDLHEIGHMPAATITATLVERVFAHADATPQEDDVTLLVVRRT